MILPLDWDQPSEGNRELCRQFERHVFAGSRQDLPYRLFVPKMDSAAQMPKTDRALQVPKTDGAAQMPKTDKAAQVSLAGPSKQVPLVVYLHGADAVGADNEQPLAMHDIGTMFARGEWQKIHPCYIVAPQYGRGQHWSVEETGEALWELIQALLDQHADIARDRVYIYGYSAGGVGTLRMVKEHPGFFAGAISICGATGRADLEELRKTPLWLVHAADDNIVKATYRSAGLRDLAHFGSRDIFEKLGQPLEGEGGIADGSNRWDFRYTEIPEGQMKEQYGVNPHCSWVVVSDRKNAAIREWLFVQRRRAE